MVLPCQPASEGLATSKYDLSFYRSAHALRDLRGKAPRVGQGRQGCGGRELSAVLPFLAGETLYDPALPGMRPRDMELQSSPGTTRPANDVPGLLGGKRKSCQPGNPGADKTGDRRVTGLL